LILIEGAITVPLDLGMVDEHVFCAAVRGDKTEALFAVEPFNGSFCHTHSLFLSGHSLDIPIANYNINNQPHGHGVETCPIFFNYPMSNILSGLGFGHVVRTALEVEAAVRGWTSQTF
jgi:hypothetical protein